MIFGFSTIVGVVDTPLRALSRGTTVLSPFLDVERDDQYFSLHNGDLRCARSPPTATTCWKTEMGAGRSGPGGRYDAWREGSFVLSWVLDVVGVTRR
ncbi:hypothetical protein Aab01nite_31580 [Paractinoplanes abujensis]|uniref:Uncharacterized protein n=1 Tax=Paractinoplanes abujensis TaxID=882441 RepID=A0A7W7D084_9ACTN|nr:hypothetical protein [Actinoplanes abujensis]MBB4697949.1 hypothetical protein [Actinoplanes abujensis]GID19568.1 hypothetical protein Aab01nite_31580 [Actinoplanes abujensis]